MSTDSRTIYVDIKIETPTLRDRLSADIRQDQMDLLTLAIGNISKDRVKAAIEALRGGTA